MRLRTAFSAVILALSAPLFAQSVGYLQPGSMSTQLIGHSYYVAIGEVGLYRTGVRGELVQTGERVQSAAAISVDSASGRVLEIVTLQPAGGGAEPLESQTPLNGATVGGSGTYVVANLVGGIDVVDIRPYGTWLNANEAMRQSIVRLARIGRSTVFAPLNLAPDYTPPVLVPVPVVVPAPPIWVMPPVRVAPPVWRQPPVRVAPPVRREPPVIVTPPVRREPPVSRVPPVRARPMNVAPPSSYPHRIGAPRSPGRLPPRDDDRGPSGPHGRTGG